MADWKDNKNLGPWALEKQQNKLGYSNNPRWTDTPTAKHQPCGYWLNGEEYILTPHYTQGTTWILKAPTIPGNGVYAQLAEYNGRLYCFNTGRLLRWNDVDAWELIAPAHASYADVGGVHQLLVYNGVLYVNVSGAGATTNSVLSFTEGASKWTLVGTIIGGSYGGFTGLVIFKNLLYVITQGGMLIKVDAGFSLVATGISDAIYTAAVYNNKLYTAVAGWSKCGRLYEWDEAGNWIQVAPILLYAYFVYELINYNEVLFSRQNYGSSKLCYWNKIDSWVDVGAVLPGGSAFISGTPGSKMVVYFDKLYICMSNNSLYVYEDVPTLKLVAAAIGTNSTLDMIEYNGRLYMTADGSLYEFNGYGDYVSSKVGNILIVDDAVWNMPN